MKKIITDSKEQLHKEIKENDFNMTKIMPQEVSLIIITKEGKKVEIPVAYITNFSAFNIGWAKINSRFDYPKTSITFEIPCKEKAIIWRGNLK